jgi:hypothetical protein
MAASPSVQSFYRLASLLPDNHTSGHLTSNSFVLGPSSDSQYLGWEPSKCWAKDVEMAKSQGSELLIRD